MTLWGVIVKSVIARTVSLATVVIMIMGPFLGTTCHNNVMYVYQKCAGDP